MALDENDPLLQEALDIFTREGYSYKVKLKGSMVWVDSKQGKRYAFYPTTGRWAPYGVRNKHYRSRGAQDFVDRFVRPSDNRVTLEVKELEKLLPEDFSCSVEEFLKFTFEMFEDGYTPNQVFQTIRASLWSLKENIANELE